MAAAGGHTLLCITSLTPQVGTETLYTLVRGSARVLPGRSDIVSTAEAQVRLADLPFVRLREELGRYIDRLEGRASSLHDNLASARDEPERKGRSHYFERIRSRLNTVIAERNGLPARAAARYQIHAYSGRPQGTHGLSLTPEQIRIEGDTVVPERKAMHEITSFSPGPSGPRAPLARGSTGPAQACASTAPGPSAGANPGAGQSASGQGAARQGAPASLPVPLALARYRCRFRMRDGGQVPRYLGSAWRGLLGHTFKRNLCATGGRACEPCLLYRHCIYAYLFETPTPQPEGETATWQERYPKAPHPFVLGIDRDSGGQVEAGDTITLGVTLIGEAAGTIPYWVHVLQAVGESGLGPQRLRFDLEAVEQQLPPGKDSWAPVFRPGEALDPVPAQLLEVPPVPGQVRLKAHTPLRVRRKGRHVPAQELGFHDLFRTLLRRLSMLCQFHAWQPLEADYRALTETSRVVPWQERDLHWLDWQRYSARQGKHVPMGGVIGEATLHGSDLSTLWPYLWIGQWVHASRGASMGLGRYELISEEAPS